MFGWFRVAGAPAGADRLGVSLRFSDSEEAENALACAITGYAWLLMLAGPRLQLGIAKEVEERILPWFPLAVARIRIKAACKAARIGAKTAWFKAEAAARGS